MLPGQIVLTRMPEEATGRERFLAQLLSAAFAAEYSGGAGVASSQRWTKGESSVTAFWPAT